MHNNNGYRYALSLTSQFYFCGVPLRLDTTPKCDLNCSYCFAMVRGGRRTSFNLKVNPNSIARKLCSSLDTNRVNKDIISEMLSRRIPIHFGGMSDPFSNASVASISRELLTHLDKFDYPVLISTKNTRLLLNDQIVTIIKNMKHIAIQISFTSLNEEKARLIEPNVPTISERLHSISKLSQEGIHVIARLQPLFPFTESEAAEYLVPRLGRSGCKHVVVEYLKLPVERNLSLMKKLFKVINWDGDNFYRQNNARLIGREWVLPKELRWEKLQILIKSIRENHMTYGSADYGLNHMGDTNCCCGIDKLPGFNNWFKGNFSYFIKHTDSQKLELSKLVKNWFPKGSIRMYVNSNCRIEGHNDMFSLLQHKWNSPGTTNAPDSNLGIIWRGNRDSQGNCVYIKKEELCRT